ncbi:tail fiber domain-containing protein [Levilactobacillus wangkuiensis]|uniref:tail fiber domain-containing protein n=1 Tax=Levilactobacillus wangkuiensis TaxID=2799566 RepID=UPI00194525C8|nr:tail fiber domain-containing protein [Levilactobacillus wangkuiensis]
MIIATGSVDINEATKLAQMASNSADDLADKLKNLKTSLDGTIIESTSTPFDDGKEHNAGDMWLVMSGDVATSMYIYSGGSWALKKWDVTSLAVEYLSALSANLGNVQAGNINGVNISGSTINGGTITIDSGIDKFTMSNSGFEASNIIDGNTTDIYGGMITLAKGNTGAITLDVSNGINSKGLSISGHTIACSDSGALYLEQNGGGGSVTDIHAADVYSNGTKLKSALSAKRDVSEYSPDEALSAVMNTDVKKWKYKDSDNSADSQHIGPIIDDVNAIGKKSASIANDMISTDENGDYFLNESNTISILLAALKKSNQRIDELSYRISQLERKNVQ